MMFYTRTREQFACLLLILTAIFMTGCEDGIAMRPPSRPVVSGDISSPDPENVQDTSPKVITIDLKLRYSDTFAGALVQFENQKPLFFYSVKGPAGVLPDHSLLFISVRRPDGIARDYPPLTLTNKDAFGELSYQFDNQLPLGSYEITATLKDAEGKALAPAAILKFLRTKDAP